MKQFLFATSVLALSFGFPASVFAASPAECHATFEKGDFDHDGWIDGDETEAYFNAMKMAGVMSVDANHDGRLTAAEFQVACEKGIFQGLQQLHSRPKGPNTGGG